jgi:hypothetical protein
MQKLNSILLFLILLVLSIQLYYTIQRNKANQPIQVKSTSEGVPAISHYPENMPTSDIKFESISHEFGVIPDNKKVYTKFEFSNTGTEPLIILSAEGSCGCTVPNWPKEPVAPGGKSFIEVAFDPSGKSGEMSKIITITSNTKPSSTILTIKSTITKSNQIK